MAGSEASGAWSLKLRDATILELYNDKFQVILRHGLKSVGALCVCVNDGKIKGK
jgi:hypothetical protein